MAKTPFETGIPRGATSFYDFSQGDGPVQSTGDNNSSNGNQQPPSSAIPPLTGSAGTPSTVKTTTSSSPSQFNGKSYDELEDFLRNQMKSVKTETPKERERREKREKNIGFLARLADGLRTFHTAYAQARGVNPMELPSMSAKAQERFDEAKAEREQEEGKAMNYALALERLNSGRAQQDYQQKMLDLRQQQQDRLDKQEETNRDIANAKVKYYEAQSNKNDEQAAYWKTKADLLERGWPQEQAEKAAKIAESKAKAAKYNHDANAPYKTGGGSSRGGKGSSGGRFPWYDKNGNRHYAKTEAEARQWLKQNGTYVDDYSTSSSTNGYTTTTSKRRSGWHSRNPKGHNNLNSLMKNW